MADMTITKREKLGTNYSRNLRAAGKIPAIIYGHGEPNLPVVLENGQISLAVRKGEKLLSGQIDGAQQYFLLKDVQLDYLGQYIIHVDLARVHLDERVTVTVPVELRGTPLGTVDGGVLTQYLNQIRIETLVTQIPEQIRVSVSEMKVDDQLRVKDLTLPEGITAMENPDTVVATCVIIAEEEAAAPAAEAVTAEPEVIGAKPEEGAEEAGEEAKPAKKEKEKE